jgi:ribosomal protein L11 methyltransferase
MSNLAPDTWRIETAVPLRAVAAFETALEGFAEAVSWFLDDPAADDTDPAGLWRLQGVSRAPVDRAGLDVSVALAAASAGCQAPLVTVERMPATDWVSANLRDFPPIRAGRFFIHGSHFAGRPPAGSVALQVDAGAAFGSGEHATTLGCLLALDRLARRRRFSAALDLGCGSGILAVALAKATRRRVLAADIDPQSVKVAAANIRRNGVAALATAVRSSGYRSRAIGRRRPYDLVVANILARPLASMAAENRRHLAGGGIVVLSGLLARQERFVLAAHRLQGLSLMRRLTIDGWSTLVLLAAHREGD